MRQLVAASFCIALFAGCAIQQVRAADTLPSPPPPPPAPPHTTSLSNSSATAPIYPGFEAMFGIEGTTTLLMLVGKDGRPLDTRIERSSGWRDLDKAALAAAATWRFHPQQRDGIAVEGYARVPVRFTMTAEKDMVWPAEYDTAPIVADSAPPLFATVEDALTGVAALAHRPVFTEDRSQAHAYVVYGDKHAARERWYFTDVSTSRAMAIRYRFAGTPAHRVTEVSAICREAKVCAFRMPELLKGPFSIRHLRF